MTGSDTNAPSQPIRERTLGAYLDALAAPHPAPGGGSVAGLTGALAAALGQMVVSLTDDADASGRSARPPKVSRRCARRF